MGIAPYYDYDRCATHRAVRLVLLTPRGKSMSTVRIAFHGAIAESKGTLCYSIRGGAVRRKGGVGVSVA